MFEKHPDLAIFGEVFLHGSREMHSRLSLFSYLGGSIPSLAEDTDWDYATQNVVDWRQLYQEAVHLGWEEVVSKSYLDANTAHVFE